MAVSPMVPALSIALPKIPDPTLIHIVGVTAVWIIFLSAIRFAAAGVHGLKPVAGCVWHLMRCRCETRPCCRRRLIASLDQQFTELLIAITTPWSVALLFLGMALIGGGLAFGSVGDVAQLVALLLSVCNDHIWHDPRQPAGGNTVHLDPRWSHSEQLQPVTRSVCQFRRELVYPPPFAVSHGS